MAKKKNSDPLASLNLPVEDRYDLFVETVADNDELWTLSDAKGLVLLTSDGDDCIPFWPTEAIAKAMAEQEWQQASPTRIELADWMEKWVPGMSKDKVLAAIYPNQKDNGTIDDPYDLLMVIQEMN